MEAVDRGFPTGQQLRVRTEGPFEDQEFSDEADDVRPGKTVLPVTEKPSPGIQAIQETVECSGPI